MRLWNMQSLTVFKAKLYPMTLHSFTHSNQKLHLQTRMLAIIVLIFYLNFGFNFNLKVLCSFDRGNSMYEQQP